MGTIVDNFTSKIHGRDSYIIPLGIVYIVPGLLCIGMFFIPESPRWLLQMGRKTQAEKALDWLRPQGWSVATEFAEMTEALEVEQQLASGVGVLDLFRNRIDRRRTLLSIAAITTQAASGAMFMIAYGTFFFEMAHIGDAFENSCILVAVGVVAVIINSIVITKWGRRRVFLTTGLIICGMIQLLQAIVYTVHPGTVSTGKAIVGLSVVYLIGYNGCISSYAWVAGGEIPSQRLRSFTFGVATAIGFFGAVSLLEY